VVPVERNELQIISQQSFDANVIGVCVYESPYETHLSSIKDLITPKKDIEGRFHSYHNNKVGAALHSFMVETGLLDLEPQIYVESYNDIVSERVVSCLVARDVTILLQNGKPTLKDEFSSDQNPKRTTWPRDIKKRIQAAKSLISGLGNVPQVLLKADGRPIDLQAGEYSLIIDMASWYKTGRTDGEDTRTTGPIVIDASLVWRMVMYETIQAVKTNESA
jgi:hypothetical protein